MYIGTHMAIRFDVISRNQLANGNHWVKTSLLSELNCARICAESMSSCDYMKEYAVRI